MNDSNKDEVQLKGRMYEEADKKYKEEQAKTPKNIGTEGKESKLGKIPIIYIIFPPLGFFMLFKYLIYQFYKRKEK
jgi:hypothetical protein